MYVDLVGFVILVGVWCGQSKIFIIQLTTRTTDFFVVSEMSVDLVGFVILVGLVYQDTRRLHYP